MRLAASITVGVVAFVVGHSWFAWPSDRALLVAILHNINNLHALPSAWRIAARILVHSPKAYSRIRDLYGALWFSAPWALSFLVLSGLTRKKAGRLPVYVAPEHREEWSLVLGEVHERFSAEPAGKPTWLTLPEAGLYGGLAITGMTGTGKTLSAVEPAVEQLVGYKAQDEGEKCSALFLEVKGNFSEMVKRVAVQAGRGRDVRLIGEWHYNPLGNLALSSVELGDTIGAFMSEAKLAGGSLEAHFWRHAGASLNGNAIEALRLNGETATLTKVFRLIGDQEAMQRTLRQADTRVNGGLYYTFTKQIMRRYEKVLKRYDPLIEFGGWRIPYSTDLHNYCHPMDNPMSGAKRPSHTRDIEHGEERDGGSPDPNLKRRLDTLKFDIEHVWQQIPEERWSEIALAAAETLKLFESPGINEVYCPGDDDPMLLAPMGELMDTGKLVVVRYSAAEEKMSRLMATMLKLDYYRSIQCRFDHPGPYRRTLFVCDEYQKLAGDKDPDFGAICRQACCARIVAYPGCEALELFTGRHWKSIFAMCNTRLFLGANDMTTAKEASDLCGKHKTWRNNPSMSQQKGELGRGGTSTSVSHSEQEEPMFKPEVFINLPVGQAVALVWDGAKRLPATRLHLKRASIPAEKRYSESVFEQVV